MNTKGFTLTEILITLAISAILIVPIMTLIFTSSSTMNNTRTQIGNTELRAILTNIFSHPNTCASFLTAAGNVTTFNFAKASTTGMPLNITLDGAPLIISGDPAATPAPTPRPVPNFNISYEYVTLTNTALIGADPDIAGNSLYMGTVVMKLDGVLPSGTSQTLVPYPVQPIGSVIFSVTSANVISACKTSEGIKDICTQIGGIPNPAPPPTCLSVYPCGTNQIYSGDDANGNPVCITNPPSTCPTGYGMTTNASGAVICKKP